MNARASRLLARVAHAHWLSDPRKVKQPQASVLADLKKAWRKTPRPERHTPRRAMVAMFNELIEGAQHG
jgi:hypothetical protein